MKYTRSECTRRFGISMDALRYMESLGIVLPEKSDGHHRLYTQKQVMEMLDLRRLRSLGISPEEVMEWRARGGTRRHAEVYGNVLTRLAEEQTKLQKKIAYIQELQDVLGQLENSMNRIMIGQRPRR